ncbi:3387_t:CDS:2 [Ambispora gerdemannii]|uniref:ATP synthase subunit delta, mitochondrial n=1 Tax=Ambispora gerdemannii TaxID=144530 RepID=A0A9N9B686_9GLOM|nr:3387_t:CDS:2 [Ambispora gerdemannii]
MNILAKTARAATSTLRRPLTSVRFYAQEATTPGNTLILNFTLPHQTLYKNVNVHQVNLGSTSGDMGILANHVPSIEQLKPGVIEVIEDSNTTQKYFVSGGFAIIHPNSSLDINAIEAFSLDDFSIETIKANFAEAQRIATSSASEEEKTVASIEAEVYETLQKALIKSA